MIPLTLKIEGFMSYKNAVTVDFRKMLNLDQEHDLNHMNVLVLTGPTGSGKSSLIDAMVCALYGKTPRIGRSLSELVYKDAQGHVKSARLEFSFGHKNQEYLILRSFKLKSGHQVEVHQRSDSSEDWGPALSVGGVNQFETWISELLGLSYDAFTRVIMLPQGNFDQFIKEDTPQKRRDLILGLTGLEIYKAIREKASDKAQNLDQKIKLNEARKATLGAISEQEIALEETALDKLNADLLQEQQRLALLEPQLLEKKQLAEMLSEAAEIEQAWEQHQGEQARISELRSTYQRSKSRYLLNPDFASLQACADRHRTLLNKHKDFEKARQTLAEKFQQWEENQSELLSALSRRPDHEQRKNKLWVLEHKVNDWEEQTLRLSQAQAEQQKRSEQHKSTQAQLAQWKQQAEALNLELMQLKEALAQTGYDAERYQQLNDALPELKQLEKQLKPRAQKLRIQSLEYQAQLTALNDEMVEIKARKLHIEQEQAATEKAFSEAEQKLRQKELENQAQALRHALHPGDPCPVCQQIVATVPQDQLDEDLQAAKTHLKNIQLRLKGVQADLNAAEKELQTSELQAENLTHQLQQEGEEIQQLEQEIALLEQKLTQYLGIEMNLKLVSEDFEVLKQKRLEEQRLQGALAEAHPRLQTMELKIGQFSERAEQQSHQLTESQAGLELQQTRLYQLAKELQDALGTESDFKPYWQAALNQVEAELNTLNQREKQAQEIQIALNEEKLAQAKDAEFLGEALTEAELELNTQTNSLRVAVQALGFADLSEAETCHVQASDLEAQEQTISQHERKEDLLKAKRQELSQKIAGRSVPSTEIQALESDLAQSRSSVAEKLQGQAVRKDRLKASIAARQESQRISAENAILIQEKQIYDTISIDLGTRNIEDFIYNRIMERLLESGSEELGRMSGGRYQFALDQDGDNNENLVVLDNWNSNEPRNLKTLSGGETFLVSLSLALALNEYLSSHAHLGSLFIDEGFGTLDPETLNQVAEAIESLKETGKFIGLITHVPELAERFENRLDIAKSISGSTVNQL
ncbi:MAG: SMC family ATPase [Candidatus Sericytochromatia bacterium]|nr:SMC family ATPase [Candidatus Sericytochromatia bacterium]